MFYKALLLPLLAQVTLTMLVWVWLYVSRLSYIHKKRIDPQALADTREAQELLRDVSGPSDNFRNLFELPVLFYTAILVALILFIQAPIMVALAWLYVLLRGMHSFIHITYNDVTHRFVTYLASTTVLWAIWLVLAIEIITR